MIGHTLGHYQIRKELGAGGMGAVYLATDTVLGREVAIKLLLPQILGDPAAKARFYREARAVAALSHPHIAMIFEAGEHDGRPFLAMEYVRGKNLRDEVAAGPLPQQKVLAYAAQMAAALEHAHARGILHRDIKSSNVLLAADDTVKLVDFGLAKVIAQGDETQVDVTITAKGSWVGTLHYAPPEVLSGRASDFRADIYSLGVVLYEMACGQLPFARMQGTALITAAMRGDVPPLTQRNPALSPAIVRVVERAMATRPEDRFHSAAEMLTALRDVTGGSVVQAVTESARAAPSLAVAEFRNISGDTESDWLGTGIAETLSADLKKVKALRVVSRERVQEAARRLGAEAALADLGRDLGVRWMVAGSYQKAGERVRITPRLLDVETGDELETVKVDGRWQDVFELQDHVVQDLVSALQVRVDSSALERIAAPETMKLEAYEQYAQGRKQLLQMGKDALEEGRRHLERAIQLDPNYAVAFSALGATHAMRYIHRTDPDDLTRAVGYLERARELDPELGEPYPWLCYAYMRQGKLEQSVISGERGVQVQPDLVLSHYFLGAAHMICVETGDQHFQRAVNALLRAAEVDGSYAATWNNLAWLALMAGEYDAAERFVQRTLDLEKDIAPSVLRFVGGRTLLGEVRMRRGNLEEAVRTHTEAIEVTSQTNHVYREAYLALSACALGELALRRGDPATAQLELRRAWRIVKEFPRMLGNQRVSTRTLAGMAWAYAANGEAERAAEAMKEASANLEELSHQPQSFVWQASAAQLAHALALAALHLGQHERALELLALAQVKGWRDAAWLESDPELASLRDEPRFREVVGRIRTLAPLRLEPAATGRAMR